MPGAKAAAIGRAIRKELSETISKVMLLAEQNLENSTPVDTGHASSNWILSVGSPYTGIDGTRENVSTAAQEAGKERIRRYDIGRDGKIYLRNNVFYLQFLDKGWSQQAPAGFVTIAFEAATRLAPYGRKTAVRRMLKQMAREAYRKGY